MPNFDGTGPDGAGPLTGLRRGPCNKDANGNTTGTPTQRRGAGRGKGRGMRRGPGNPTQK